VSAARRWVLASGNPGKLAELRALFAEAALGLELVAQSDLGVSMAEEHGTTFAENALAKARHAAGVTGLPAIADDSGLAVAALGGAPGVRSARYAGDSAADAANVVKLLAAMRSVPDGRRSARFHCVLVAVESAADAAPLIASGEWAGEIARTPAGTAGFGYDPVFFDPALGKTAAELPAVVKNRVSHRAQALQGLVRALRARAPGSGSGSFR
jgi:XTP/dITP diphosphohydrolase